MDKRVSFVFYRSFYDAVLLLEPEEQLDTLLAICAYALDGAEPSLSGPPAAIFAIARANLEANQRRYENGRKGGRPKADPLKPEVLPKETARYEELLRKYNLS